MIKSILVGLDSGENTALVQKYALELGLYFEAETHGIHVLDVRKLYSPFVEDLLYSAGLASVPDLQSIVRERLDGMASLLEHNFGEELEKHGLKGEFHLKEGLVGEELTRESRKHDLLVIGTKGEHYSVGELLLGSTFSEVIRSVSRPILVVPEHCKRFYIKRVLVAYDGSDKSSNALRFVTEAVRDYNLEIEVLVCDDGILEDPRSALDEAGSYLNHHGVKHALRLVKGEAAECILEHAGSTNCDAVALGSYSRGLVKSLFLGSVAREILEQTAIPALLMG